MNLCFIDLLEVTEFYNLSIVMFDEDDSVIYANKEACKLFNANYTQLKQHGIQRLVPIRNKISDLVITDIIQDMLGNDLVINYLLHRLDLVEETIYLVIFGNEEFFLGSAVVNLIARIRELQYFILNKWRHNDSYNLSWLQNIQFNNSSVIESYLANNCFELFLQPIVNEVGVVTKFEVLTRLVLADNIYAPGCFLPFVQRHRLTEKFDEYVLSKTINLLKNDFWSIEIQRRKYCFAINISPSSGDFYQHIQNLLDIIKNSSLDGNYACLEFEITEGVLIQNEFQDERILMKVAQLLHEHGITLAMDDFGIKNSSLERLIGCDFDVIKIDMSVVSQLLDAGYSGKSSQLVMRSLVSLATDLNVELVVEGVETKELYLTLQRIGCKIFQGYYFFKPLPIKEVESLIMRDKLDQQYKVLLDHELNSQYSRC